MASKGHTPEEIVVRGEREAVLENRRKIQNMIPRRGIKYALLVRRVSKGLEVSEVVAERRIETLLRRHLAEVQR